MDAIYNGSNSFRVFNNVTSEFVVGRRVKMDCGLDGVKYASVVSSSYSAPYTTVQIDESDLTAALTDVWYAVVTAGTEGSLPNHSHDGSEGSGGTATSFSGIDDHGHAAYVPWDFGSDTISGTGDIYCNDIHTSSGTVYIGDLQLTSNGNLLLVDGQAYTDGADGDTGPAGADGADGNDAPTTFSGLTDTPDTYDDGYYLRMTASGITTISGVILEAPNGSEWLLQVTNSGTLYTTEVV